MAQSAVAQGTAHADAGPRAEAGPRHPVRRPRTRGLAPGGLRATPPLDLLDYSRARTYEPASDMVTSPVAGCTTRFVNLRDGRRLAYTETGDPKGPPVIHHHGMPGSRSE